MILLLALVGFVQVSRLSEGASNGSAGQENIKPKASLSAVSGSNQKGHPQCPVKMYLVVEGVFVVVF